MRTPAQLAIKAFREENVQPAVALIFKAFWDKPKNTQGVRQTIREAIDELRLTSDKNPKTLSFCEKLLAAMETRCADTSKSKTVSANFFTRAILSVTGWANPDEYIELQQKARAFGEALEEIVRDLERVERVHQRPQTGFSQHISPKKIMALPTFGISLLFRDW